MRKNALALGVATALMGLAGTASAGIVVTPGTGVTDAKFLTSAQNGMGHINIIPYYTTQGAFYSTLNIVNTDTTNGKALKVRFRSAINSDDVFDFQVLMSPGDVWAAAVTQAADGRSKLITSDKTCTQPAVLHNQSFITSRLPPDYTDTAKAAMTREGYVEILTMADIPPAGTTAYNANWDPHVAFGGAGWLYRAVKHVSGVAPCTPEALENINDPSSPLAQALVTSPNLWQYQSGGLDFPTQGIFTNWTMVNVPTTSTYSGEAEALVALSETPGTATTPAVRTPGRANLVFYPQNATAVGVTHADTATADPLLRSDATVANGSAYQGLGVNAVPALSVDLPDLSTPYTVAALPAAGAAPTSASPHKQATDLTQSIATRSISNEFYVNPGLAAATDWTFSMPTRRYHVVMDYLRASRTGTPATYKTDGRLFSIPAMTTAADPFQYFFTSTNTRANGFEICTTTGNFSFRDREEQTTKAGGVIISPAPVAGVYELCGETNVLVINGPDVNTFVLGADQSTTRVTTPFVSGWLHISTANSGAGLPVIGSTFMKLNNANATPGVSGNYGLVHTHRYDRTHY